MKPPELRRPRRCASATCALLLLAVAPASAGETGGARDATAPPAETRHELWRRLREAKLERIEPYRPGLIERQILAFEKAETPSLLNWNLLGVYPRIQGVAKGSENALGARLWHPQLGGSGLDLHASAFYSVNRYELYDVQLGVIPGADFRVEAEAALPLRSTKGDDVFEMATIERPDRRGFGLYGSARYEHFTRLPYFGLGADSRRDDETTFLQRGAQYELVGAYQLGRVFVMSTRVGLFQPQVGPGEDPDFPSVEQNFDEETAAGLGEQPDFWKLSAQALLDFRDVVGNPKRGAVVSLQLDRFGDRDLGEYSFTRYALDARGFIPVGSPQRNLALRVYVSKDDADRGAHVPFYLQQTLGGSHTLRGFRNFRFRGTSLALLQAEYRWEAVPAIELALFVDSGTVAEDQLELDLGGLRTSFGAGLRLKLPDAVMMRLEWAASSEDQRFYMRFSPAW